MQARDRGDEGAPRFGFTVTRKTAGRAVDRNRIKRRLREAVRHHALPEARAGTDYVLVARRAALDAPFADLCDAVSDSLREAHRELNRRAQLEPGETKRRDFPAAEQGTGDG